MSLHDLEVAFAALTRFPSRLRAPPRPHELEAAVPWFPLVGAAVGGIASGLYLVASLLGLPGLSALLVALAGQLLATGALHEIGVARTVEALTQTPSLGSGMPDHRARHLATIALVLLLLARVSALMTFWAVDSFATASIAAAAFSRALIPLAIVSAPAEAALRLERGRVLSALGLALAIALVLLPPRAVLVAALCAGLAGIASALYLARRLGGCDGDCAGAVQQSGELAFLIALALAGWPGQD